MNLINKSRKLKLGYSLIELLITISLLGLLLPVIFGAIYSTQVGKAQNLQRTDSAVLLLETSEIMRIIREKGWELIATNDTFHPVIDGQSWLLADGGETVGDFYREVVISDAQRDSNGNIVESGGEVDPSTKKVVITISWNLPVANSSSVTMFFTRYLDNLSFIHTTQEDFDAGEHESTITTLDDDGEVTLDAGGQGSWCNPFESIVAELDLPKNGVALAISAVEGKLAVGTGANASGVSFANVSVSGDSPPVVQIAGTLDGYKTNDVFNESNYAYLATDTNSKEVVIIDTSNPTPSEVGYFNAPGSQNAESVVSSGNTGFVLQSNKLYSFDLSSKNGERSALDGDGVDLAGTGTSMVVVGNYAYVTIDSGSTQLQVVDISNTSNLSVVGQAQVNDRPGKRVTVEGAGNRAYLVTQASDQAEFFIIDVSSKSGNQPAVGSFEANGMDPKSVTVVSGNRAIIVGHGGEEYQVIDISNENSPSKCGGLDFGSNLNDIDAVLEGDGDAFSYLLTTDSSNELQVIVGGPGGQHSGEGTYTSPIFDNTQKGYFNRFDATTFLPVNTNITMQVAVANPADNNCSTATYSYVGPDGTPDTFFDSNGIVPFNSSQPDYGNPGQCFRYQVNLSSSDGVSAPIFEDITVNYSP